MYQFQWERQLAALAAERIEQLIDELYLEGKAFKEKARVEKDYTGFYSAASAKMEEAANLCDRHFSDGALERRILGKYYRYEQFSCLTSEQYQLRNTDQAEVYGKLALQAITKTLELFPSDYSERSPTERLWLVEHHELYQRNLLQIQTMILGIAARRLWDNEEYIGALDKYEAIEDVARRLYERERSPGKPTPRIALGNYIGAQINRTQAMAAVHAARDRSVQSQLKLAELLGKAYTLAGQAYEANPEWQEYYDNQLVLYEQIKQLVKSEPAMNAEFEIYFGQLIPVRDALREMSVAELPSSGEADSIQISQPASSELAETMTLSMVSGLPLGPPDLLKKRLSALGATNITMEHGRIGCTLGRQLVDNIEDFVPKLDKAIDSIVFEVLEGDSCIYERLPEIKEPDWPDFLDAEFREFKGYAKSAKLLLVTTTDTEVKTVLNRMIPLAPRELIVRASKENVTYHLGAFGQYAAVLVQTDMGEGGREGATLTVERAINQLKPKAVIMIGIAFGMDQKKQRLGDVLVAEAVNPYEKEKVNEKFVIKRGLDAQCGRILSNRFRKRVGGWLQMRTLSRVRVFPGLVLSGSKVVNSLPFRMALQQSYPIAIGGEMEGAGAYAAADGKAEIILIKSICDWADGHKVDQGQPFAAHTATELCYFVLNQTGVLSELIPPPRRQRSNLFKVESLPTEFDKPIWAVAKGNLAGEGLDSYVLDLKLRISNPTRHHVCVIDVLAKVSEDWEGSLISPPASLVTPSGCRFGRDVSHDALTNYFTPEAPTVIEAGQAVVKVATIRIVRSKSGRTEPMADVQAMSLVVVAVTSEVALDLINLKVQH